MDSEALRQPAESEIKCSICEQSINTIELYQCVRCNDKKFYCKECGDFVHRRQRQNHEYSGPNIKQVEQIDGTQLELKQKEGESYLHYLITQ